MAGVAWKGFCSWLSVGEHELFYTTSEPSVGEAVSFPYKIVPNPTMAAAAESDADAATE